MVPEPIFNDTDDAAEAIQEWEFFRLPVSTQWITFEDRVASLAIERMVGCHAIVLVSRRGAFVCHFYEDSFFELYSTRTTMTACLRGLPEDSPSRAWHEYGIEDVRDNPEDGKRGVILGNQEGSDGEDDFEDVDAFIITPRERPGGNQQNDIDAVSVIFSVFEDFLTLFKIFLGDVEIVQDHLEANLVDRDSPPLHDILRSANINEPASNQQRTHDV
ncbi:hypothetical protein K4K61_008559 [Colletotrichum sp. SAR11_59]|nr:hypothetical protein K4K61_008559 [Colletotrichum sp. SAR11_59]